MLPGDGVLRAAYRWLRLLERSTLSQASGLIRADPAYTDLSPTQYATAFEWLARVELLQGSGADHRLATAARGLTDADARQLLFARSLAMAEPAWLPDADSLVRNSSDLPQDAADLAAVLGLDDTEALIAIRQVQGRIDLVERARVGAEGEKGLARLLERRWPGSTNHVALKDDGLGYDIAFTLERRTWHLEVKTTTRRGRLVLYLSRHEHEVGLLDPNWRLVVVGLDPDGVIAGLATVRSQRIRARSPQDHDSMARWESVRHQLLPSDLRPGLAFLGRPEPCDEASLLYRGYLGSVGGHLWLPAE